jgi:hypothetical protein
MDRDSPFTQPLVDNLPRDHTRVRGHEVPGLAMDEVYVLRMAWEHAVFVGEFGLQANSVVQNERVFSAYPDYFERWLELGCRGLHQEELEAYLRSNPLEESGEH